MIRIPEVGVSSIIYVGIFLGVLLIFDGFWQMMPRSEEAGQARNRRMRMIAGGASTQQVLGLLKPAERKWGLSGIPLLSTLPQDLQQAGFSIKPGLFLAIGLAATIAIALALAPRFGLALSLPVGIALALLVPAGVVRRIRSRRLSLLVSQLPDALELMARGLKVGHPLNSTISTVARDMDDPIATEFGIIVDQVSYGDDLVDAFRDFADRVEAEDARYLATSVAIQNGTGGDLARILQTLSKVIRARITMRKRIMAISSEGRLTAIFMSLLPLIIFGMTSITSPDYYFGVSEDPMFRPVATSVMFLVVANYLVMRRLVNFRI
jgi:tight adherence protein B